MTQTPHGEIRIINPKFVDCGARPLAHELAEGLAKQGRGNFNELYEEVLAILDETCKRMAKDEQQMPEAA